jgi:hypothetical protein
MHFIRTWHALWLWRSWSTKSMQHRSKRHIWWCAIFGFFFKCSLFAHDTLFGYEQIDQQSVHDIANISVTQGQLPKIVLFLVHVRMLKPFFGKLTNKICPTLAQMTCLMRRNFHILKNGIICTWWVAWILFKCSLMTRMTIIVCECLVVIKIRMHNPCPWSLWCC